MSRRPLKCNRWNSDMDALPEKWKETPDAHGWVPPQDIPPHIVCAANKTKDGLIFCGSRHGSNAMFAQMQAAGVGYHETEDGFIDRYDRWWSREQAYEIMKQTRQPMLATGGSDIILYSEHLY